jgi:hypothetical protein
MLAARSEDKNSALVQAHQAIEAARQARADATGSDAVAAAEKKVEEAVEKEKEATTASQESARSPADLPRRPLRGSMLAAVGEVRGGGRLLRRHEHLHQRLLHGPHAGLSAANGRVIRVDRGAVDSRSDVIARSSSAVCSLHQGDIAPREFDAATR